MINVNVKMNGLLQSFFETLVANMFTMNQGLNVLDILSHYLPGVPRDPITISHTPCSSTTILLSDGVCIHLRLCDSLFRSLTPSIFILISGFKNTDVAYFDYRSPSRTITNNDCWILLWPDKTVTSGIALGEYGRLVAGYHWKRY